MKSNSVFNFVIRLIIVGITIFIISAFFFQIYFVDGISMEPTLTSNQPVLIKKFNYQNSLKYNDIIVVYKSNLNRCIIKRIIGMPGDSVIIKDGIIYVNDSVFNDISDFPKIDNPGNAAYSINLKSNEYFVLGDNRNNSLDSRFDDIGIISSESIRGKVILTGF